MKKADIMAATLFALIMQPTVASELPPLSSQSGIDRSMLWAGLAIETSEKCPSISLRKLKGISFLWSVRSDASKLGYSDDQIRAYVESDAEKARIRQVGEAYIRSKGFDPSTETGICAFGQAEIVRGSIIGGFLR
ncbi:DUF5333 domain-containing protein [Pseudosulfitobacter pseudonitzschiae]|uniref:DUF5333 domain-containing protein n=1 Tax=Pseudosulfitobacter pseudonitzschiae TaxID=1402135 RepID=UPI003B812B85